MVNSICIKTNNTNIINNLLNNLENINLNDIYLSQNDFKNYKNVIIHYRGNSIDLFYSNLAEILSNTISDNQNSEFADRNNIIFISILKYIIYNKSMILDGFVNFRLKDYISIIDDAVDFSVNKFLVEREYSEFVNLLKIYINSKESQIPLVHLVYANQESILLDKSHNTINTDDHVFEAKYLSDISFSSNDYALNTLLTLLPEKIYIHLINCTEDEFINTLKLIFDDRIYLCNDCDICKIYKSNNLKLFNLNKK